MIKGIRKNFFTYFFLAFCLFVRNTEDIHLFENQESKKEKLHLGQTAHSSCPHKGQKFMKGSGEDTDLFGSQAKQFGSHWSIVESVIIDVLLWSPNPGNRSHSYLCYFLYQLYNSHIGKTCLYQQFLFLFSCNLNKRGIIKHK